MRYRDFKIGKAEREEILEFDALYRINEAKEGRFAVLLDQDCETLEESLQKLLNLGLSKIDEANFYYLSEDGKKRLGEYGKMYQRFIDLSIFKCVYPEASAPEDDSEADPRFGTYGEEANPPHSEDYRIAIFENFSSRQNRRAPLHIFAYFSLIKQKPSEVSSTSWIWRLGNGEIFKDLEQTICSQVSAESIAPEGWSQDEIIDEIYRAGMKELKRNFESEDSDLSPQSVAEGEDEVWVETVVDEYDSYGYGGYGGYYDPYWDCNVGMGSAFCVGAFAGLATCALLF